MKLKTAMIVCFLVSQLTVASGAWAGSRGIPMATQAGDVMRSGGTPFETYARDGISLDEAVARVRRQTGGRVIKATSRTSNGRTVYHIRVLTADGRVFTVRVDAASGRNL